MPLTDDRQPPTRPMPAGGPGAAPGDPAGAGDPGASPTSVFPAQTAPTRPRWEQCDRCQAPVDTSQRYCVVCGTSQRRADDPAARYFAAARRRRTATAAPVATGGGRTVSTAVAALLIALLPVAAGIGIVVGRGSADSGDQIIEALKAAQGNGGLAAPGAAASGTGGVAATTAEADAAADDAKPEKKGKVIDGVETQEKQAEILSTGPAGSARKLEGTKPTAKDIEESKKAVEQINARKGKEYIETQRDLPDTIVIP